MRPTAIQILAIAVAIQAVAIGALYAGLVPQGRGPAGPLGAGYLGDTINALISNETQDVRLDSSRPLTGTAFYRNVDNSYFYLSGGQYASGHGAFALFFGSTSGAYPGSVILGVPNATKATAVYAMQIAGVTDTPYVDLLGHKIEGVVSSTLGTGAVNKTYVDAGASWGAWSPYLQWAGGVPTGYSSSARYSRDGNTVHFIISASFTGNTTATTNLYWGVPVNPATQTYTVVAFPYYFFDGTAGVYQSLVGYVYVNSIQSYTIPTPCPSGHTCYVQLAGFYDAS